MRPDLTPWIVMLVVLLALIPLAGVIASRWTVPPRRLPGEQPCAVSAEWEAQVRLMKRINAACQARVKTPWGAGERCRQRIRFRRLHRRRS